MIYNNVLWYCHISNEIIKFIKVGQMGNVQCFEKIGDMPIKMTILLKRLWVPPHILPAPRPQII
jgi:hypothetical protein